MKIACIANMNNMMFSMVRYLRDVGYDAHLFLVQEFDHFLPGCDSYTDEYKSYTHQLDWYETGYWKTPVEKIRSDLKGYDVIIGSDLVPAFLHKAGIRLDVFVPHGSDLCIRPFHKFKHFPPKRWELGNYAQARAQRLGIQKARYVIFEYTNENMESTFDKVKFKGERVMTNAMNLYTPQYTEENFAKQNCYAEARALRENNDMIVFHQSRQVWLPRADMFHYKGNDILIKAFARFVKENPTLKSVLVMFEYGTDAEASKELVKELGIEQKVKWLPLMLRKDIMVWLNTSDICVGELGFSYLAYGTVFEDLALKKPFIGYRRDELYLKFKKSLYPMVSVNTEEGVYDTLVDFLKNKNKYIRMGQEANQWLEDVAMREPLDHVIKAIKEKEQALA